MDQITVMLNKQWIRASEQEQIDLQLAARQLVSHGKGRSRKKHKEHKKTTMSTIVRAALFVSLSNVVVQCT